MKVFMYRYKREGTSYNNQKLLIFADSQHEADIKAAEHMKFLKENDDYRFKYKINESLGEICGLDIQEGFEDSYHFYGVKQENNLNIVKDESNNDYAEDVTRKYVNAIDSFSCDFELLKQGEMQITDMHDLIMNDKIMNSDIDLLCELSFGLRHKTLKIIKTESKAC